MEEARLLSQLNLINGLPCEPERNSFVFSNAGINRAIDAVRAALAIQDDVAAFNSANRAGAIALKLGLHSGACIAVTAAGVLDYFGATVNIAARLEHQCAAGEVVVSGVMLDDPATNAALGGRTIHEDQAILRGFNTPLRFFRVHQS